MPVTTPGDAKDVRARRLVVHHQARQRHRGLLHRRQRLRRSRSRSSRRPVDRQGRHPRPASGPAPRSTRTSRSSARCHRTRSSGTGPKTIRDGKHGVPHQRRDRHLRHGRHGGRPLDVHQRVAVEVVGLRPRRRQRRPDDRRGHAADRRARAGEVRSDADDAKTTTPTSRARSSRSRSTASTLAWFTGCSGLSLEFDVTTFKEGNGKKVIERKRAGQAEVHRGRAEAGLHHRTRRCTTGSTRSSTPPSRRRTRPASIVIYDRTQTEVRPVQPASSAGRRRCRSPTSAPAATTSMVEELTIQHEFLDWVEPDAVAGLQTEFAFTLPKGYVDGDGVLHRHGTMRLATARDEIEPLRDQRVDGPDDPYLTILVHRPGHHRARHVAPGRRRTRSRACSPPTWRSCRTSTASSTSAIPPTSRRCRRAVLPGAGRRAGAGGARPTPIESVVDDERGRRRRSSRRRDRQARGPHRRGARRPRAVSR